MDWVLRGPTVLNVFTKLGYKDEHGYHIYETCNEGLQSILQSLLAEDKCLRQYRRGIAFGQYIQRDLVPLLLASQQEKTTELLIKILADLTRPVDSLFGSDANSRNKQMLYEINNMVQSAKATFTDYKATKAVIEYLKRNTDVEHSYNLTSEQCVNIDACLTLLRNLLHHSSEDGMAAAIPVVPMSVMSTAPTTIMSTVPAMTAAVMPKVPVGMPVGPGVTTVGMPVGPGVMTVGMPVGPGVTTVGMQVGPGVTTVGMPVGPGVTTVGMPVGPGVSTVGMPVGPGVTTVRMPVGPGVTTVGMPVGPGVTTVGMPVGPGVTTVGMPVGPGVTTVGMPVGPGVSTVGMPVGPGVTTVRMPVGPGVTTVGMPVGPGVTTVGMPVGPGVTTVGMPVGPGVTTVGMPVGPGVSTVGMPVGPGVTTVRMPVGPGVTTVGMPVGPGVTTVGMPVGPGVTTVGMPVGPGVTTVGMPVGPGVTTVGMPVGPGVTTVGMPVGPGVTTVGMPVGPGVTTVGMPVGPGVTTVGMPTLPGLTTVGMPALPGVTTVGMPAVPGLTTFGMPVLPGVPTVGMPVLPGLSTVGMPVLPGVTTVGMPAVPGLTTFGMPVLPGVPTVGMPVLPGLSTVGMPVLPGISTVGMPVLPGLSTVGMPVLPGLSTVGMPVLPGVSTVRMPFLPRVSTFGMPAVSTVGMPVAPAVNTDRMPVVPAVNTVLPSVSTVWMPVLPGVSTVGRPVLPAVIAPEMRPTPGPMTPAVISPSVVHNQIVWNIFSHGVDKILIQLMTVPEAELWCMIIVQILALVFRNQSCEAVQRLVTEWLGTCSEGSEEDETNTSPAKRDSKESSPLLTSDPMSDSSGSKGNGTKRKEVTKDKHSSKKVGEPPWRTLALSKVSRLIKPQNIAATKCSPTTTVDLTNCPTSPEIKKGKPNLNVMVVWEPSFDCGCSRQPIWAASSNDDESKHSLEPKVHNPKHKINLKDKPASRRQKKKRMLMIRAKAIKLKFHDKMLKWPTDSDVVQVLKEFTIDFLVKGFNTLVQKVYGVIRAIRSIETDTSHFFWLVSYFLKFATDLELDMEQVNFVLSFEMVSYFTAESVNICEQFNLVIKQCGCDPYGLMRRQHMLVAAIREFVRAIHTYTQHIEMTAEDRGVLLALQEKMCATEELRLLFVLLLRQYDPKHQSKQYLQDLIIANHNLLVFLEIIMETPKFKSHTSLKEHLKQFATVEMMHQYGYILEDYKSNGALVNDCVFTLMHHVGGEFDTLKTLFQPNILQTFTAILNSKFVIGENWSDLIEYAINSFIMKPQAFQLGNNYRLKKHTLDVDGTKKRSIFMRRNLLTTEDVENEDVYEEPPEEIWTEEEISSLGWHYLQCEKSADFIGQIVQQLRDEAVFKSRESVLSELYKQNLIDKREYDHLGQNSLNHNPKSPPKEVFSDEIAILCEELSHEGRGKFLSWVQMLLLDTCFAKIYLEKLRTLIKFKVKTKSNYKNSLDEKDFVDVKTFELFKSAEEDSNFPLVSPVAEHFLLLNESVPVVPWNSEQAAICKDLRFLHLLHRLGFQMPVDTGKLFIRVPCNWSAEHLYDLAGKVGFIDPSKLKFSVNSPDSPDQPSMFIQTKGPLLGPTNYYQIRKKNFCAAMLNLPLLPLDSHSLTDMESEASTSYVSRNDPHTPEDWLKTIQQCKEEKPLMEMKHEILDEFEWNGDCCCRRRKRAPPATPHAAVLVVPDDNPVFDSDAGQNSGSHTDSSVATNMSRIVIPSDTLVNQPITTPRVYLNLKRSAPEYNDSTIQHMPSDTVVNMPIELTREHLNLKRPAAEDSDSAIQHTPSESSYILVNQPIQLPREHLKLKRPAAEDSDSAIQHTTSESSYVLVNLPIQLLREHLNLKRQAAEDSDSAIQHTTSESSYGLVNLPIQLPREHQNLKRPAPEDSDSAIQHTTSESSYVLVNLPIQLPREHLNLKRPAPEDSDSAIQHTPSEVLDGQPIQLPREHLNLKRPAPEDSDSAIQHMPSKSSDMLANLPNQLPREHLNLKRPAPEDSDSTIQLMTSDMLDNRQIQLPQEHLNLKRPAPENSDSTIQNMPSECSDMLDNPPMLLT